MSSVGVHWGNGENVPRLGDDRSFVEGAGDAGRVGLLEGVIVSADLANLEANNLARRPDFWDFLTLETGVGPSGETIERGRERMNIMAGRLGEGCVVEMVV